MEKDSGIGSINTFVRPFFDQSSTLASHIPPPPIKIGCMDAISSLQNPRVKTAAKLRDRRGRDKQQRILIDGTREIARALAAGVKLLEVFVSPDLCTSRPSRELLIDLGHRRVPLLEVTGPVFEKLAYGARGEGLVAVAEPPRHTLAELKLPEQALVAVLAGVEKPGNVGAVLRSADAVGASALIVADAGTDLYNPNCIRASLGTVFTLPVCAVSSGEALDYLRSQRLSIYAARLDAASADYRQVSFAPRSAIVLGSEAAGLSDAWRAADIAAIQLPMLGIADSLNVSATAAVLFYEALRQREMPEAEG
jgi:RNA methyltransferase, TrmH family